MMTSSCPFCSPEPSRVFYEGTLIVGLWDAFPVNPGHALLAPRRHVDNWFEATSDEQAELTAAISLARNAIRQEHVADGFTIGINVGPASGQTIFHLHVHVIPRYHGDVPDPRGGVRNVIPDKGIYRADIPSPGVILSSPLAAMLSTEVTALVHGDDDPLLPHLLRHLDNAWHADIAVAFILPSGVRLLEEQIRDLLARGGSLRLLTGDYLGVTDPDALMRLIDFTGNQKVELRVFETRNVGFHPKAYIFNHSDASSVAYVGSSNLTASALRQAVEWNYQIVSSRDQSGFAAIQQAFDALFHHPDTRLLDYDWVQAYRDRRIIPVPGINGVREPSAPYGSSRTHKTGGTDEEPETMPELSAPPAPHPVQEEALAALEHTRAAGNSAGLVVLATGLGKTWLSAFDSARPEFHRVLFVAHREEILDQAMKTFRRIRPLARLGLFTGTGKMPDAEVLIASIQTLGKAQHLQSFDPRAFDYIVVDEFHHAAAKTYRLIIDHFQPRFLLGLTATPERSDGGDLLALCEENLVYRCDLIEALTRGLLSPVHYFGVPDDVDYSNIPWRNGRFDEDALTQAVATQARARNALEQYKAHAGQRALVFCCSQRHADFMASYFREHGLRAVAVHSGESSAPRATSLEALANGQLDIICAVDMFNEGVDLPNIDTIMMLRPTGSRILWLQQIGRGLRKAVGKDFLRVIDYIGNHRTFLLKLQTLFQLGPGDAVAAQALERIQAGELSLPQGCEVTYELEAIEILRSLFRPERQHDELRAYYVGFREQHGMRPTALEAFQDGYHPRSARRSHGSWLRFVDAMGDLNGGQQQALVNVAPFLDELETTPMTRSYKMLVLIALLNANAFPGELAIEPLVARVAQIAGRSATLRADISVNLDDQIKLRQLIERHPIHALTSEGNRVFVYEEGTLRSALSAPDALVEPLQELTRELVDWRLAEYLKRPARETITLGRLVCQVRHVAGNPILRLPDREGMLVNSLGWFTVVANEIEYEASVVRDSVTIMRPVGSEENALGEVLRRWFGLDAGLPGTRFFVELVPDSGGYRMAPVRPTGASSELQLWREYQRDKIPPLFGLTFSTGSWNQGYVATGGHIFLLVTLEKSTQVDSFRYSDRFLTPSRFEWQSQNQAMQAGSAGQAMLNHFERNTPVHLFVRPQKVNGGKGAPFTYCGDVTFMEWEGDKPITIRWLLPVPVPAHLHKIFRVPEDPSA